MIATRDRRLAFIRERTDTARRRIHFLEHTEEYCRVCGAIERKPIHKDDCTCLKPCPDCEDGEREVRDDAREFDTNERWKKIPCERCNATGEI